MKYLKRYNENNSFNYRKNFYDDVAIIMSNLVDEISIETHPFEEWVKWSRHDIIYGEIDPSHNVVDDMYIKQPSMELKKMIRSTMLKAKSEGIRMIFNLYGVIGLIPKEITDVEEFDSIVTNLTDLSFTISFLPLKEYTRNFLKTLDIDAPADALADFIHTNFRTYNESLDIDDCMSNLTEEFGFERKYTGLVSIGEISIYSHSGNINFNQELLDELVRANKRLKGEGKQIFIWVDRFASNYPIYKNYTNLKTILNFTPSYLLDRLSGAPIAYLSLSELIKPNSNGNNILQINQIQRYWVKSPNMRKVELIVLPLNI